MGNISSRNPLKRKERVLYRYLKIEKVLSGLEAFGTTFVTRDSRNDIKYIVKKTKLQDGGAGAIIEEKMKRAIHEVEMLKKISNHENIVTFYDFVFDGTELCLIFEICEEGNLNDFIREGYLKRDDQRKRLYDDIYKGLEFIHQKNIAHNNLKPENILMWNSRRSCKLAHLGLATYCETTNTQYKSLVLECYGNRRGTRFYWSPEVNNEVYRRSDRNFTFESDIFSLGLILLVLWDYVTTCIVFLDDMYDPPHRAIVPYCNGKPYCECHQLEIDFAVVLSRVPEDVREDIKSMLQVNPRKRITL